MTSKELKEIIENHRKWLNGDEQATSIFNDEFKYRKGDSIEIKNFNLMYNVENSSGIHFFRTKEEAENYLSNIRSV